MKPRLKHDGARRRRSQHASRACRPPHGVGNRKAVSASSVACTVAASFYCESAQQPVEMKRSRQVLFGDRREIWIAQQPIRAGRRPARSGEGRRRGIEADTAMPQHAPSRHSPAGVEAGHRALARQQRHVRDAAEVEHHSVFAGGRNIAAWTPPHQRRALTAAATSRRRKSAPSRWPVRSEDHIRSRSAMRRGRPQGSCSSVCPCEPMARSRARPRMRQYGLCGSANASPTRLSTVRTHQAIRPSVCDKASTSRAGES